MVLLKNIFLLIFLLHSVSALLVGEVNDIGNNTEDLDGSNAYRLENDESVAINTNLFINPEEIGDYNEGDILTAKGPGRAVFKVHSPLWPIGNIPYVIEGNYSAEQREMILYAMFKINLWTCVQFVPHSGQRDYIVIRNVEYAGCASYVGRIGGRQELFLEAPLCFTKIGTTYHELLHAIGLLHEHNRPDRNQYITVNVCNVRKGKYKFFKRYRRANVHNFSLRYNYNSIMHFSEYSVSRNGQKTIVPAVKGLQIGQRNSLDATDIRAVTSLYKCNLKNTLSGIRSIF